MGSWAVRTHSKAAAGGPSKVADCGAGWAKVRLASERATGGPGDKLHNPDPAPGNKASNHQLKTPMGVEVAAGETPSFTGEFAGETHRVLECTQTHPPRNQHQRGPIWLWVAEGVIEVRQSGASATAPSWTPPPHTASQCSDQRYPA